jgi:hypothetical protein
MKIKGEIKEGKKKGCQHQTKGCNPGMEGSPRQFECCPGSHHKFVIRHLMRGPNNVIVFHLLACALHATTKIILCVCVC